MGEARDGAGAAESELGGWRGRRRGRGASDARGRAITIAEFEYWGCGEGCTSSCPCLCGGESVWVLMARSLISRRRSGCMKSGVRSFLPPSLAMNVIDRSV